jgi:hypothetical protein
LTPENAPSPRASFGMTYDGRRERVLLFGGMHGDTDRSSDTWLWDGSEWEEVIAADPELSPRGLQAMAYHATREQLLLFGGMDDTFMPRGDTWTWDGERWRELDGFGPPPARFGHAMAYDLRHREMVVFGGTTTDTWVWNGTAWRDATPAAPAPSDRRRFAMAWDGAGEQILLFGGTGGDGRTWAWRDGLWQEVAAAVDGPGARADVAMAWDADRERVVLFGGGGNADTWEWTGTGWLDVTPDDPAHSPPARDRPAMAYDAERRVTVLFGGVSGERLADTWEWDGVRWTEVTPADPSAGPSPRSAHTMAYDAAGGRVVLFAGNSGQGSAQDLWAWDGEEWSRLDARGLTSTARLDHAMAYDLARDRLVVFGGRTGTFFGQTLDDLWELDLRRERVPAFQFEAGLFASGIPPSAITGVRVRAHAGSHCGDASGAALHGWATRGPFSGTGGVWAPLAANASGLAETEPVLPAPPGAFLGWTASGDQARAFMLDEDGVMPVQLRACTPAAPGQGDPAVGLDYLEVRVQYLIP